MSWLEEDDIDLDEFLDGPVSVDMEELTAPVKRLSDEELTELARQGEKPQEPLQLPPQPLDLLKPSQPHISMVTSHASSQGLAPRRPIKFRHLVRTDLLSHPIARTREMLAEVRAQAIGNNPLDKLSPKALIELTKTLQGLQAQVSEGAEVAILLAPPDAEFRKAEIPGVQRLAMHLNTVPVDGVVFMKMDETQQALRVGLLKLGLAEGVDYEMLSPTSLLSYERQAFEHLLSRRARGLRILRRISKKLARI